MPAKRARAALEGAYGQDMNDEERLKVHEHKLATACRQRANGSQYLIVLGQPCTVPIGGHMH